MASQGRFLQKRFFWHLLGIFLSFSSYSAMRNLQPSLTVVGGLGATTLSVHYLSAIVICLFITPFVIRQFGPKKCLIFSEFTMIFYILANLYPATYTLIPAAIITGFGYATIWTCMSMINVYFGKEYSIAINHRKKNSEYYESEFTGLFWSVYQAHQIFGNLVSYAALYAFQDATGEVFSSNATSNFSSLTTVLNSTSDVWKSASAVSFTDIPSIDELYYCGTNDCQEADVVKDSISKYVPTNKTAIYILIGILLIMCVSAQILHGLVTPQVFSNHSTAMQVELSTFIETHHSEQLEEELVPKKQSSASDVGTLSAQVPNEKKEGVIFLTKHTLKLIGNQLLLPKQILMIPLSLYVGLKTGFMFSEFTRAYASCVLGVAQVGICMSLYGLGGFIMSYIMAKHSKKLKRTPLLALAALTEISNYLYCLLWIPSESTSWTIYCMFFMFSLADGINQTLLNVIYIEYFTDHQDIALTIWNLLSVTGYAMQYSWSTSLCVDVKTYIQIGVQLLGFSTYYVAERLYQKEKRVESEFGDVK